MPSAEGTPRAALPELSVLCALVDRHWLLRQSGIWSAGAPGTPTPAAHAQPTSVPTASLLERGPHAHLTGKKTEARGRTNTPRR